MDRVDSYARSEVEKAWWGGKSGMQDIFGALEPGRRRHGTSKFKAGNLREEFEGDTLDRQLRGNIFLLKLAVKPKSQLNWQSSLEFHSIAQSDS
jgi:hypothetical protein